MKRLLILTLFSSLGAAAIFFFKQRPPTTVHTGKGLVVPRSWLVTNLHPLTGSKDVRPPDQTFLTFPEWFLVFSPEEQAHAFTRQTATSFPYMAHTAQIWESYHIVSDQIRGVFPVNTGYHFMIWVIGTSATVEYAIKALYETVVGRLTDTGKPVTPEDVFNASFTQEYVDFIKDRPWYEFDFKSRLFRFCSAVPFRGENIMRSLDRRYLLTSELLVKWGYGKLIGLGTKSVYEEALPTTAVITDCAGQTAIQQLPRYDKFGPELLKLARKGCGITEIAGNTSAVLLTVWVRAGSSTPFQNGMILFTQPITSDSSWKRVAIVVPVRALQSLMLEISDKKIYLEHVFDF